MARQIEYDPTKLKQNLLSVFWAQGYAETSLADLESASGLNRRQLYNGIGDKRSMFLQALDDFSDEAGRKFLVALEREDAGPRDIEMLLRGFIELSQSTEGVNGCMVCSTSQEEIAADEEVSAKIDAYFNRIRAAYSNALSQAARRGEISLSAHDVANRAEALFGTHVALCILARARRPVDQLNRLVGQALNDIA